MPMVFKFYIWIQWLWLFINPNYLSGFFFFPVKILFSFLTFATCTFLYFCISIVKCLSSLFVYSKSKFWLLIISLYPFYVSLISYLYCLIALFRFHLFCNIGLFIYKFLSRTHLVTSSFYKYICYCFWYENIYNIYFLNRYEIFLIIFLLFISCSC